MSEDKEAADAGSEHARPPGQPRSWERREDPSLSANKRWGRIGKVLLYAVWITLLVIAIVAIVLYKLNPPR